MKHFLGLPIKKQLILLHRKKVPHINKKHSTKLIKGSGMTGCGAFVSKNYNMPDIGGKLHITHKKHIRPLVFKR